MFKLPFGWLPGHWGLKGKTREIAKAEYELEGLELELKLLSLSELEYTVGESKRLEILKKHGKITEKDYLQKQIDLITDEEAKAFAQLEFDFKQGKITELAYQKERATLKGEPWVTVINMDFSQGNSLEGSFELDWNQFFVEKLKNEGYKGANDEATVNMWFMEVCRNVAMEEFSGVGDFAADSEANLETVKRWSGSENIGGKRKGYK